MPAFFFPADFRMDKRQAGRIVSICQKKGHIGLDIIMSPGNKRLAVCIHARLRNADPTRRVLIGILHWQHTDHCLQPLADGDAMRLGAELNALRERQRLSIPYYYANIFIVDRAVIQAMFVHINRRLRTHVAYLGGDDVVPPDYHEI